MNYGELEAGLNAEFHQALGRPVPQWIMGAGGHSWILSSVRHALGDLQPSVLWVTGDQDWVLSSRQHWERLQPQWIVGMDSQGWMLYSHLTLGFVAQGIVGAGGQMQDSPHCDSLGGPT